MHPKGKNKAKKKKFTHPRILVADLNFKPCELEEGHEFMPNGMFTFNITRLFEYIERHPEEYKQIEIDVAIYHPWKSGKQI